MVGQYQIGLIPRQSPDKVITQKVGYTNIEIAYGSPNVRGRQIWGIQVPFDQVWRAGANNATQVTFSNDVVINGTSLLKGTYTFFIIPKESDSWVAIFNTVEKQWGSFKYEAAKDALRTEVFPRKAPFREDLAYHIEQQGYEDALLVLHWDRVRLDIPIQTNYTNLFKKEINTRLEKTDKGVHWVLYVQAAQYFLDTKKETKQALDWINESERLSKEIGDWNVNYYPINYIKGNMYWVKANLLGLTKEYEVAIGYLDQLLSLEGDYRYEVKNELELKIEELKEEWGNRIEEMKE